jgi:hypothetical protein
MPPPHQPPSSAFLSTVLNNSSAHPSTTTPPRHRTFAAAPAFSATQRSLQARGKEYNVHGRKEESYETR